jgi:hypothetical protein
MPKAAEMLAIFKEHGLFPPRKKVDYRIETRDGNNESH